MGPAACSQGVGKYFPILALAQNQWAAAFFMKEAALRDKKKEIGGLGSVGGNGDEGGVDAGSRSPSLGDGAHESEAGAFGEGAESQEAFASAAGSLASDPRDSRRRARIAPSSGRR